MNGPGRLRRPWIGAEVQDVTADIATSLGMARPEGALIVSLHPESPLAKAGLKRGDIILAGAGTDRIHVYDSHTDRVYCGPGRDTVWADRSDKLYCCEVVHR